MIHLIGHRVSRSEIRCSEATADLQNEAQSMMQMMAGAGTLKAARLRQGFARLYPGISFQTWYPVVRQLDAAGFFIRYQNRERHVWRAHFELMPDAVE